MKAPEDVSLFSLLVFVGPICTRLKGYAARLRFRAHAHNLRVLLSLVRQPCEHHELHRFDGKSTFSLSKMTLTGQCNRVVPAGDSRVQLFR